MNLLSEIIKQLNKTIIEQTDVINEKIFIKTLHEIKATHKIKYSFFSLSAYYKLQLDKLLLKKRKSILLNDYEAAAECRDFEHKYIEKIKVLHENNNEASEFFIEDNYIIFCYHKQDKRDNQIIEILSELM